MQTKSHRSAGYTTPLVRPLLHYKNLKLRDRLYKTLNHSQGGNMFILYLQVQQVYFWMLNAIKL